MASTGRFMEKASQEQQHQQQQQQQQQPLKCPRCDSSNTKFCYYNNYSLSQPRHFCKACKRYWTRGGTLRNVPVGGGCRKNKRVKRPGSASEASLSSSSAASAVPAAVSTYPNGLDLSSTSRHVNPVFYGLPTNPSELNFPYPRLNSTGFDLQPQDNNFLGLGFSSRLMGSHEHINHSGFSSSKQIQDVNSNQLFSSSYAIHGSTTTPSSTSLLASLVASSLQQQKLVSNGFKDMQQGVENSFYGFSVPLENLNMAAGNAMEGGMTITKEKKIEGDQNRLEWNNHNFHNRNHTDQINHSTPDISLWNTTGVGAWLDPSSVPSLI